MGKKELHSQELSSLVDGFIGDGRPERLIGYMLSNSNLPGRRANLELAEAFGDVIEEHVDVDGETARLWQFCSGLAEISVDEAPVNTSNEFLPFCGAIGIGAIGSISPAFYEEAVLELRTLAHDPRWRMREAVRFGVQRLLAKRCTDTLRRLAEWVIGGSLLEMRAAAAGVADPCLLENEEVAVAALQIHGAVFERIAGVEDRRAESFKVLRKALSYTLSVVVRAIPKEGFSFMERLVASQDRDVLWIVKQNIRKNRIAGNYPGEVESIQQLLGNLT
jgi:hypothetical protein